MNVLDENIPIPQKAALRKRRVPVRQIGFELARKGTTDADLIVLLQHLNRPTLFTLDRDFYHPRHRHSGYCIVHLDVEEGKVAAFIRRFLKHPQFKTRAKRMGCVIRVMPDRLTVWRRRGSREEVVAW